MNHTVTVPGGKQFDEFYEKTKKEAKEALNKYTKEQRFISIIKSGKYIPLDKLNPKCWFSREIYNETISYDYYLFLCEKYCEYVVKEKNKLTKEEFDLVVEMLCN